MTAAGDAVARGGDRATGLAGAWAPGGATPPAVGGALRGAGGARGRERRGGLQ
ncbi:MAG: hypothetical protein ACI9OJ_000295 [Myxococcota bacterium]